MGERSIPVQALYNNDGIEFISKAPNEILVEINIPGKELNILISTEELSSRLSPWSPPEKRVRKGYLAIYSKLAKSAEGGAALNYKPEL